MYTHTGLKIAIIGRPNVGKSTLFNRLASAVRGRGHEGVANPSPLVFVRSVVDSVPGVTRDPREASAALSDLLMTVVDTPGLEHAIGECSPLLTRMKLNNDRSSNSSSKGSGSNNDAKDRQAVKLSAAAAMCDDPMYRAMYEQMEQKTEEATRDADLIFFVIDAGDGVTVIDKAIAEWLHRVVNESSESDASKSLETEAAASSTTTTTPSSQQQQDDQSHNNNTGHKDIRKNTKKKHVMVIANKCDLRDAEHHVTDAYELGFNDPIAVSAEQGLGFADLYAEIDQLHERLRSERQLKAAAAISDDVDGDEKGVLVKGYNNPWKREADGCGMEKVDHERERQRASFDDELVIGYADRPGEEPLRQLVVSIIGRPNVGKSTLLNRLAGESKSLVGPEAGVTRDAVLCQWRFPEAWRHPKQNYGVVAPSNHYQQRERMHERIIHGNDDDNNDYDDDDDVINDSGSSVRAKNHYGEQDEEAKRKNNGKGLKFDLPLWLVDTAGVRAQTKVLDEKLEALSVRTSLRALRHSHVVLLVIDALEPLVCQDTKLMDLVVTHGRAVVLVINKMDRVNPRDMKAWRDALRYRVDSKLSEVAGVEMVEVSAKTWDKDNEQMRMLFDATLRAWNRWERRVPTAQLNRFVQRFNERVSVGGGTKGAKRNRMGVTKFVTQRKIRPPVFRLDGASAVSMNYLRALTNAIRHEFGLQGVPIRVKRPSRGRK